jgi:hypothetical protein
VAIATVHFAIYFACWLAGYVVAFICVANIAAPIHYAVDPTYATERAHKRQVKQLQVGQRIRVADAKGEDHGTITRIDPSGEFFDITWDADGHTNTLWHFDLDIIESCRSAKRQPRRRAGLAAPANPLFEENPPTCPTPSPDAPVPFRPEAERWP